LLGFLSVFYAERRSRAIPGAAKMRETTALSHHEIATKRCSRRVQVWRFSMFDWSFCDDSFDARFQFDWISRAKSQAKSETKTRSVPKSSDSFRCTSTSQI
jgi:hypothetical protein